MYTLEGIELYRLVLDGLGVWTKASPFTIVMYVRHLPSYTSDGLHLVPLWTRFTRATGKISGIGKFPCPNFVGELKFIIILCTYCLSCPMLSFRKFILYMNNRNPIAFGHRITYTGCTGGILYSIWAHALCAFLHAFMQTNARTTCPCGHIFWCVQCN